MPTRHRDFESERSRSNALVFPRETDTVGTSDDAGSPSVDLTGLPESAEQVYAAIETMSRRIEHLARELNCLGHFDDDDDRPRAA